ncbi:tRNA (guanine-N(7)-)-methyltransferase non-catalytic subunit wuho [Toxorhynchites rutilus septentrionalis]|uniref:tRNA (guanine-N(7)-)-methyltransferase non-catalytic subunit wuho n=1 Tax=Toxorhynchites rutilus septentrionalis TaxID=329112 RepID=UPI00247B022C|nr:tRNA (guanine-N(7)-)-methyltransferase non-catalytic subunit wuho [Toxorhynchites rutilus septentrionalis]
MSFLKSFGKSVIIAFNQNIFFYHEEKSWSHRISLEVPIEKGRPRKYFDADSDSENEDVQNKNSNCNVNNAHVVGMDVHDAKSLLAIATSDKSLYLYAIVDIDGCGGQLKLLSRRLVSRTSSCLKFSADGNFLLVCDKGGDCYKYDCEKSKNPGLWLFGHMSQILDILINSDDSLIVTCDRDEKIRITNYPDCHNIETFCLGHSEFVSHIEFLKDDEDLLLLSLSGDKTMRLWNVEDGKEQAKKECDQAGNKLAVKDLGDGQSLIAMLCYPPTTISVYVLTEGLSKWDFLKGINAKSNHIYSSLTFDSASNLLALTIDEKSELVSINVFQFNRENFSFRENDTSSQKISEMISNCKLSYTDSVSFLFKKKFDNIKNYHERKRKRLEVKS